MLGKLADSLHPYRLNLKKHKFAIRIWMPRKRAVKDIPLHLMMSEHTHAFISLHVFVSRFLDYNENCKMLMTITHNPANA